MHLSFKEWFEVELQKDILKGNEDVIEQVNEQVQELKKEIEKE
jgi:hypothetical protein